MMLPTHERTMIVIPAQGMIDIRDAMTDILAEFGKEEAGCMFTGHCTYSNVQLYIVATVANQ